MVKEFDVSFVYLASNEKITTKFVNNILQQYPLRTATA